MELVSNQAAGKLCPLQKNFSIYDSETDVHNVQHARLARPVADAEVASAVIPDLLKTSFSYSTKAKRCNSQRYGPFLRNGD